ncbi:MAG: slipin family protein [Gemmataceae bacterium]
MINEMIVKPTHRGLWYEDGVLKRVIEAGRYELPAKRFFGRTPNVDVTLVDMRSRELTIKGQEILTSDKVAIRVSVLVQYSVTDPIAAIHAVESYPDRLYSDVQLAARRSLAAMSLEEILTNRTRLSEDILHDVKEVAASYGVAIARADVKDLTFPGNLQEIMNKVLAAERNSQAQLVEARTKAAVQKIEVEAKAESQRLQAATEAEAIRMLATAQRQAMDERKQSASVYEAHPSLLRLEELATLREMAKNANARIYLDFKEPLAESQ